LSAGDDTHSLSFSDQEIKMNVHEHDWTRRPTRVAMVALVATLLVGVVGSDLAGTASARRGSHAQA
jgi:hypothetical protein